MAPAAPPPNPSLVAIILVIRTRSSRSQFVFHYPPNPLSAKSPSSRVPNEDSTSSDDTSSSDSEEETTSTSGEENSKTRDRGKAYNKETRSWRNGGGRANLTDEEDDDGSSPDDTARGSSEWKPCWEPLLGLGEGLAGLLTPGSRCWHKRKFEVSVNDFCFLGWPVFVREDGTWQKRKQKSSKRQEDMGGGDSTTEQDDVDPVDSEGDKTADGVEGEPTSKKDRVQRGKSSCEMTMFNVVFVLNPPILEHTLRVKEMYDHVVKKLGRALKWEQGRVDYVWKESELMLSIKSKHISKHTPASTMYKELLSRSSLANAISTVYKSISASRIASVTLTPTISISLQIPPLMSISVLPSLTDPPTQSGLWLTTANDPSRTHSDIDTTSTSNTSPSIHLAKHFSLLLLDSPQKILKDISIAGGPLAAPLSTYIQASSPTKSFFKISAASSISLADIQLLARHLVYWRRAIAIPPLHRRDTYIVSPNADMRKLKSACKAYEAAFPTLPSLPKMLAALSGTPRPWASLVPSGDHKDVYFQILAWLMRGGWVTQLRTFAFVRVDPKVKKVVSEKEKTDKRSKRNEGAGKESKQGGDITPSKRPSVISRPSSDIRQRGIADDNPTHASLILHPQRASPLESKHLDHIGETLLTTNYSSKDLSDEERAELKKHWPTFVRYMNGMEALEKIPVRENLKRKVVWEIFGKLGLDFDHGTAGKEGQILVGVRHW